MTAHPFLVVTGAGGQLGLDLIDAGRAAGMTVHGLTSAQLDITSAEAVDAVLAPLLRQHPGAVVVNAAAYTAVDRAESDAPRAFAVNGDGPGLLAAATAREGSHLIHVSTDYVFAGDADRPYEVDASTGPQGVYGASKLAGEQQVHAADSTAHIVRTSWLYGGRGQNFVRTMVRLALAGDGAITVVADQHGAPTATDDLAAGLIALATAAPKTPGGVLHATASGETTWAGFARSIFAAAGADPDRVQPISSADWPAAAARPAYSVLSNAAWRDAGLPPLPDWSQGFAAAWRRHGDHWRELATS